MHSTRSWPGTPASSTTKTGRHDIAEILLKVALKYQKSIIQNHESERQCIYTCMLRVSILSLLLRFFLLDLGLFLQCGIIILFTLIVDGTFMGTYVKMTSPYLYSTIDSYTTISRLRCSDKCTSNEECRAFVYHELHTTCILYEPYSGKDMHMCDGTTECYIKQ